MLAAAMRRCSGCLKVRTNMKKVYKKLTKDQKERGVIFSSILLPGSTLHEVFAPPSGPVDMQVFADIQKKIALLKDDKFFNNSPYKVNEIRQ